MVDDLTQKPLPDQYYPGGVLQQNLDWNVEQHQAIAGGDTTATVGPTGPAGPAGADGAVGPVGPTGPQPPVLSSVAADGTLGCVIFGDIICNWGATVVSTAGVTVSFIQPYVDNPPVVTTGMANAGGDIQVTNVTLTGVTIKSQSSTPTVYWVAFGS